MHTRQTVLVAEDDENDALLLQRALIKADIHLFLKFVRDGQEAVEYLNGDAPFNDRDTNPLPQLLILDLKMPRLTGFEVLGWIRRQPGLKRLPVVVMSSSDLDEDVNRAYDLGANSYFVKPFDTESRDELAQKICGYWLKGNRCAKCVSE